MNALIVYRAPDSLIAEAYRTVYAGLRPAEGEAPLKTIVVTSALPSAETSIVAANLAAVAAQTGKRVLLADCNFRHPMQHETFGLNLRGLSDCIATDGNLAAFCQPTGHSGLDFLASGTTAGGAALTDKLWQMISDMQKMYDMVFLAVPSVLAEGGALSVAVAADGVLLVVPSGEERLQDAQLAKKRLLQAKTRILGCVLNQAKVGVGFDGYYCRQGGNSQ